MTTEFCMEYEDLYTRQAPLSNEFPNRFQKSREMRKERFRPHFDLSHLSKQQNFICRIKYYTGETWSISNLITDTLSDLHAKVNLKHSNNIAHTILSEYRQTQNGANITENMKINEIRDLFVKTIGNTAIKSIPETENILLIDFIRQNPDYFVPDKEMPYYNTYTIFVVDDDALEQINKLQSESLTYWDKLRDGFMQKISACVEGTIKKPPQMSSIVQ